VIKFRKNFQNIFLLICIFSTDSFAQSQSKDLEGNIKSKIREGFNSTISRIFPKKNKETTNKKIIPDNKSLMYEEAELDKIKDAIDAFKNQIPLVEATVDTTIVEEVTPIKETSESYIYLGSILYRSKNNWSLWINDGKISPENNYTNNEIYVKSVNKDQAEIIWAMSISKWKILTDSVSEEGAPINDNNQVEFNFILRFNQSYILNENIVVEGRAGKLTSKGSTFSPKNILKSIFN
jgi:hypothetical protein